MGILALIAFICGPRMATAAPITFAQFQQATNADNAGFAYIDQPATITASDDNQFDFDSDAAEFVSQYNGVNKAPIPVIFNYLNVAGLPSGLEGPLPATLVLKSCTTQPVSAAVAALGLGDQQFMGNGSFTNKLCISLVTPFDGLTNLLTMTFTGQLVGALGGRTPSLSGNTALDYTVDFSSDFLTFAAGAEQDFSLTFTSWTSLDDLGGLEIDTLDNYFESATAQGTGTFDSSTLPSVSTPEPAGWVGGTIGALFLLSGRRLRRLRLIPQPC